MMEPWPRRCPRSRRTSPNGSGRSRCSSSRRAPSDGHVNVSPKGYDTFRVLDPHRVAYLDLTGSGVETIAHLRENGRITVDVLRVRGEPAHRPVVRPRHRAPGRILRVRAPGSRRVPRCCPVLARSSKSTSTRISTSCGYAVPLMDLVEDRERLHGLGARQGRRRGSSTTARRRTRSASTGSPAWAHELLVAHRAGAGAHGRARRRRRCCCSVGADLPYLTGYEAMPLERLTMLVLPRDGDAQLVVPRLEAPRVVRAARRVRVVAVGGDRRSRSRSWRSSSVSAGAARRSATRPGPASCSTCSEPCRRPRSRRASRSPVRLRVVKDAAEIAALRRGRARGRRRRGRDAVAAVRGSDRARRAPRARRAHARRRSRARRTSPSSRRVRTPPARTTSRRPTASIGDGDVVLCDFGGTMQRLLLRHHAHVPRGRADRRGARRCTTCSSAAQEARRAGRHGRDAVRSRRRRRACESSPTRGSASSSCIAPVTASAARRTRTRTWSSGNAQPLAARSRVQRRARASTCPGASACGSRTSSSRPPPGRTA